MKHPTSAAARKASPASAHQLGSHSRHNESVYVNLEAEVTHKLSGGVALRHERYSDFGSTTSAKGSARYAFTDAVAARHHVERFPCAIAGAAVLHHHHHQLQSSTASTRRSKPAPSPVSTPQARALGAQDLKPEKARNYSLGLQFQPNRNWTTSVDAYRIDIDNRIPFSANMALNDALKGPAGGARHARGRGALLHECRRHAHQGVDIVSTYRIDLQDKDRLDFTVAYNHNKSSVEKVADNPAILTANNLKLIDRQTISAPPWVAEGQVQPGRRLWLRHLERAWPGHALRQLHRAAERCQAGPDV
jgi:iron complex outermembrane receptor protein